MVAPWMADWIEREIGLVSGRRTKMADTDPLAMRCYRRCVSWHYSGGPQTGRNRLWCSHLQRNGVWLTVSEAASEVGTADR